MLTQSIINENHYEASESFFWAITDWLSSEKAHELTHNAMEERLLLDLRELGRLLYQAHLNERGGGYDGPSLVGADGVKRPIKRNTSRSQESVFGRVKIERVAYQSPKVSSLRPKDAELNLPPEIYSHGVRKRIARESSKGSYDEAIESVEQSTGARIPKRQAEELAVRAASDFTTFYEMRSYQLGEEQGDIIVVTCDGKGIAMRYKDLRPQTQKAAKLAQKEETKQPSKRLKKGQKRNRKRMATVASVYSIDKYERTAEEVTSQFQPIRLQEETKRPKPQSKRVWASVEKSQSEVIGEMLDEATNRDPQNQKEWVGLIDGAEYQKKELAKQAENRGISLVLILDIIHVIEYLWKAAYCFAEEGSAEAQDWVSSRLLRILQGKSSHVAAGIRRSATKKELPKEKRKNADTCCDYLLKNKELIRYDIFLAKGYPIATGVIEGACRYLVKDRMDRTGARWSLEGAEAILKLRALVVSDDFEEYWDLHMQCEYQTHHGQFFQNSPKHQIEQTDDNMYGHLKLVK